MLRQSPGLLQIGLGLIVLGVVVKLATVLVSIFSPLAGLAIGIGVILAIIGLVTPRKL